MMKFVALLALYIAVVLSSPCSRYLDSNGVDNSTCGEMTFPCKTLRTVLRPTNETCSSLTVFVGAGEYKGINNTYIELHSYLLSIHIIARYPGTVIFDAEYRSTIITVSSGNVNFTDIKFKNGFSPEKSGACVSLPSTEYTYKFTDCEFIGCRTPVLGGGLYASGFVYLERVNFTLCHSGPRAGALWAPSGAWIVNSTFTQNSADVGGAIWDSFGLTIIGTTFRNNSANIEGGSVFTAGNTILRNCDFFGNTAKNRGGALSALGEIEVYDTLFRYNSALQGGAIAMVNNLLNSTLILNNITVENNEAYQSGGGIYSTSNSLLGGVIKASGVIRNNKAQTGGGWDCSLTTDGKLSVMAEKIQFEDNSATICESQDIYGNCQGFFQNCVNHDITSNCSLCDGGNCVVKDSQRHCFVNQINCICHTGRLPAEPIGMQLLMVSVVVVSAAVLSTLIIFVCRGQRPKYQNPGYD